MKDRKLLDEIASILTEIAIIEDREYQKINYVKQYKNGTNKTSMVRSNPFRMNNKIL